MKKLMAISLALVLLTSNIGLAMVSHYCGGQAVKSQLTIGHGNLGCGMDMRTSSEQSRSADNEASGCSEYKYQAFAIEDDYSLLQLSLDFDAVAAFVLSFLEIVLVPGQQHPQCADYSPPLLLSDIHILNQVFII